MTKVIRLNIDNESTIFVQTKDLPSLVGDVGEEYYQEGVSTTGAISDLKDKTIEKVLELPKNTMNRVSKSLVAFSKNILQEFSKEFAEDMNNDMAITIEYGVNFVGNLDVQIASVSHEAAMKVEVSWTTSPSQ